MRYFYDTEFLEDGRTIELISIGIVSEDGREYYAVAKDAPWKRINNHDWLRANVLPTLPRYFGDARMAYRTRRNPMALDFGSPLMRSREQIAREVVEFIQPDATTELWADYSAYDHVAFCQLWGTMMDLPSGMPMWTHDLEQLWESCGKPERPRQTSSQHNALEDARWNAALFKVCIDNRKKVDPSSVRAMFNRGMWPLG